MFLHLSVSHSVHEGAGGGRKHACPLCHTHPLPGMPPAMHPPAMHAPPRILRDAVNERVVHILLECILVLQVIKYETLVGLGCKA